MQSDKCIPDRPLSIADTGKPRVVIIGGGFAGMNAVKALKNKDVQVVLVDRNNYHQFVPLIYQVATCGLEPDSVSFPLRKRFQKYKNFNFRLANVERIAAEEKTVYTDQGWLRYDYLIIASGSATNFLGKKSIEEKCYGLKTVNDAINIRSLMLTHLERAAQCGDDEEEDILTNFVIVGGGPAGVELAGALSEFRDHIIPKDYPEYSNNKVTIYLLQAGHQLLKGMTEASSKKTVDILTDMGVKVMFGCKVMDYDGRTVKIEDSELEIKAATLIWAAGVKGQFPEGIREEDIDKKNRLKVNDDLSLSGYPEVFAIGDVAGLTTEKFPDGLPMVAPAAIQGGSHAGKNIMRLINGEKAEAFDYTDKGSLATIGRRKAVADIMGKSLSGFTAWLMWAMVHIFYLAGFKNKVSVLFSWVTNYLTYDRADRLITRKDFKDAYQERVKESQKDKVIAE